MSLVRSLRLRGGRRVAAFVAGVALSFTLTACGAGPQPAVVVGLEADLAVEAPPDLATPAPPDLLGVDLAGADLAEGPDLATPLPSVNLRRVYDEVLSRRCGPCHIGEASGALAMDTPAGAYAALLAPASPNGDCAGGARVAPGNAAASVLYRKVSGVALCGARMPLGAPALPANEIDLIRVWIDQGARLD